MVTICGCCGCWNLNMHDFPYCMIIGFFWWSFLRRLFLVICVDRFGRTSTPLTTIYVNTVRKPFGTLILKRAPSYMCWFNIHQTTSLWVFPMIFPGLPDENLRIPPWFPPCHRSSALLCMLEPQTRRRRARFRAWARAVPVGCGDGNSWFPHNIWLPSGKLKSTRTEGAEAW